MIIFDTETTGLVKSTGLPTKVQPKIIEIYAILLDETGAERDRLSLLINPGEKLDPEITRITGITNEMLAEELGFKQLWPRIKGFFEQSGLWVGHNVTFDHDMLTVECRRHEVDFGIKPRLMCTVEETEHLIGRRLSLTDLHTHLFGAAFDSAHRAESDVRATHKCLCELVKRGEIFIPGVLNA